MHSDDFLSSAAKYEDAGEEKKKKVQKKTLPDISSLVTEIDIFDRRSDVSHPIPSHPLAPSLCLAFLAHLLTLCYSVTSIETNPCRH
jgi:hypothetical protein